MAITNLAVFGGAFMTPVLVGKITHSIGWQWTFYLEAIFCATCLPAIIFLVPETAYRRSATLNTDLHTDSDDARRADAESAGVNGGDEKKIGGNGDGNGHSTPERNIDYNLSSSENLANGQTSPTRNIAKKSYAQTLKPFSGWYTSDNFFKILLSPLPLFLHPAILWGCLIQGSMIGWTVFIGVDLAAIMLGPPLWWGEVETGYAYVGAFIGAILGFLVAGGLADWSAKVMTKRNGGIYEPEFRIILVIPMLIFGCAGLYGFGVTSNNLYKYHWVWPVFFFGLEVMGMVIGAVASSLYIVDVGTPSPNTSVVRANVM